MGEPTAQLLAEIISAVDWSAWLTALATLILAILTFVYVCLTRKILSNQSDPCVVLTVVHDDDQPSLLMLVAKNIGTGLAYDVRFEFSHPIPAKAFGIEIAMAEDAVVMNDGPLINGIPALGPGESRKISWGQIGGLQKAIGGKKITATCRFKKNIKEMPPTICPLDIESFFGTSAAESPSAKSAKELAKISKEIQHFASGHRKLKVEISSMLEHSVNTQVDGEPTNSLNINEKGHKIR